MPGLLVHTEDLLVLDLGRKRRGKGTHREGQKDGNKKQGAFHKVNFIGLKGRLLSARLDEVRA